MLLFLIYQADELEEGEIPVSGDSPMDQQQSGSWIEDRDEGENEQVLQPKIKRKRSIRLRPRHTTDRSEEKPSDKSSLRRGDPSQLPFQVDHKYKSQARDDRAHKVLGDTSSLKSDKIDSSIKNKRNLPSRRNSASVQGSLKSGRVNYGSTPPDDATEHPRENLDSKVVKGPKSSGPKMSEVVQRKVCCSRYLYLCDIQFELWLLVMIILWTFFVLVVFITKL